MTITEFKRQCREWGLTVSKVRTLEAFEIAHDGTQLFRISYAELYPLTDIRALLEDKLRPEADIPHL
jgi:hypothetical protein